MLSNKNQKYIFERLLKGLSVAYQLLDEDRFVFTDGVRLFIFSKEQIKFDISKCALGDRLKEFLDGAVSGRMYTPSEEIRVNDNKGKTYRLAKSYNITPSMSRKGNPYDNALAENFFSILKIECIYRIKLKTYDEARLIIDEYIDFYNNERIQLKTKLTPQEMLCQYIA